MATRRKPDPKKVRRDKVRWMHDGYPEFCRQRHPYTETNTTWQKVNRKDGTYYYRIACRACLRRRARERYHKLKRERELRAAAAEYLAKHPGGPAAPCCKVEHRNEPRAVDLARIAELERRLAEAGLEVPPRAGEKG